MKQLNTALMGLGFCFGTFIGYHWEHTENQEELKEIQEVALEACQVQLNDAHHCISICLKEWDKIEEGGKYETGKNNK